MQARVFNLVKPRSGNAVRPSHQIAGDFDSKLSVPSIVLCLAQIHAWWLNALMCELFCYSMCFHPFEICQSAWFLHANWLISVLCRASQGSQSSGAKELGCWAELWHHWTVLQLEGCGTIPRLQEVWRHRLVQRSRWVWQTHRYLQLQAIQHTTS